ncbi:electron transfer flavoprotein alpha subunit [Marchantia polymorpha subsp. ruderalis]|uniref:Electron transfer flavoprotein subunit alpha n=2 Tax=Marchantia polymorpha TaxID=3197 RepID=A0A176VN82_MARPO|nr:hypothetical protein AXG93_1160s1170 [Marchantia polymorpha subsp. ruderalis]PTQ37838.1 hypothetical protein MARPO_0055s0094 [Marchantia polymorpha]BBN02952.1 hypothetical protein Mp_2g19570 [Marchantia polymorpha subsp. ruderalis]|eukprot:PTQ37838.1 hypothetical protein MARPO_0055s0094 [Marchantia polymorpha]
MFRFGLAAARNRRLFPLRSSDSSLCSLRLASTLVVGEHEEGVLKASTLSAVAAASALGDVSVLVGGFGPSVHKAATQAASAHSAISQVLVVDWEKVKHELAEPWAELLLMAQEKGKYSHVLAASSSFGKNIVPRAAALLDQTVVSDVIKVVDEHTFVRPVYAGNALSTVKYTGSGPCFMTIRPTAFPAGQASAGTPAPIATLDTGTIKSEAIGRSEWVGQHVQRSERPELGSARVVVSGGRALKSAENFKLLETLADKLGGAVGASRAAVDAGFVPNDMQVGQTGKIVAPDLYIAVGISGAIQHLAGMKDSKVIVAINKDADCPIFQVADYGLAADLFQAVPELIEKLPDKRQVSA